jgi:hypothetical protein
MLCRRVALPVCIIMLAALCGLPLAAAQRATVSLDGQWRVADGIDPNAVPATFDHTVAVPGLANQAQPGFPDVDCYITKEAVESYGPMYNEGKVLLAPPPGKGDGLGWKRQNRNYLWYERTFTAPAKRFSAVLVVGKAQFGTAVWLNGKKIGEHIGCHTAGRFNVTEAMNWNGENRLLVRIGAHPGAMPKGGFYGLDSEKRNWTPGIYDSVSLELADNPVIETLQVAPRIDTLAILVATKLKNLGSARACTMTYRVRTWKDGRPVGQAVSQEVNLAEGEEKTVTQTVPVPNATLWSPDNPFLYVLDADSGGDGYSCRFGMREFHCDSKSGQTFLNGKPIYLRGASITLHRFLADPHCGGLPWDDAWVRRLLEEIPHRMNWNGFRICIGLAPQKWLDVADEAGILLQYEFPIWDTADRLDRAEWNKADLIEQFREYVRDNWNHPSVVIWNASNETDWKFLGEQVIPEVRKLDLSRRPWNNGYRAPQEETDPCDWHAYVYWDVYQNPKADLWPDLDRQAAVNPFPPHAAIINEYDCIWLHRDGRPTLLGRRFYDRRLGPHATAEERFELCGYTLGELTEFWRSTRRYAAVMYLAYLDADYPGLPCKTCDNFRDVRRLVLEPRFEDYMGEASKPLGVCIKHYLPTEQGSFERTFRVILTNDTYEPAQGTVELSWRTEDGKRVLASGQRPFAVAALGQAKCDLALPPPPLGNHLLVAKATWPGKPWSPIVSRRKIVVGAALGK